MSFYGGVRGDGDQGACWSGAERCAASALRLAVAGVAGRTVVFLADRDYVRVWAEKRGISTVYGEFNYHVAVVFVGGYVSDWLHYAAQ